jgi:tetratricopeptide (TPR) repeat protein
VENGMKKITTTTLILVGLLCSSIIADQASKTPFSTTELYDLLYPQNAEHQLSPIARQEKLMEYFGYAPDLVVNVAATYFHRVGDYEKALECKTRAIELNPTNSAHYLCRALTYRSLEKNTLAEKDYDKAIEIDPKEAWHYVLRANFLSDQERYFEAGSDLIKALEIDPDHAYFQQLYADVLFEQGWYEKALQWYSTSLNLETRDSSYLGRAKTYEALGKLENALDDFDSALEFASDSTSEMLAYYYKVKALHEHQRSGEALMVILKALELHPTSQPLIDLKQLIEQSDKTRSNQNTYSVTASGSSE